VSTKIVVGAGAATSSDMEHRWDSAQDWTNKEYLCFWLYGANTGGNIAIALYDGAYRTQNITDSTFGWSFHALKMGDFTGLTVTNISRLLVSFYAVGTYYLDFINIGCKLDFVTGYTRTRTSKIPLKKIPAGISRRDADVYVRDRTYRIKARLTAVCRDCLESLDDDQAWMGLDDQRIQETVWLDTMPLEHAMGYSHEPETTNIILVVSAV